MPDTLWEDAALRIETKVTFLESTVAQLERVCLEQGQLLDRLAAEHRLLRDKYRELQDSLEDTPSARPPHY